MTTGAMLFMAGSWGFVLGLMFWSFAKILRHRDHTDADGTIPGEPPVDGSR